MRTYLFVVILLLAGYGRVIAIDIQTDILDPARRYLGSGYCRGGTASPCFDCSGFVTALYRRFLPDLPRISRDMARYGQAVTRDQLEPGDLLFFATSGSADRITHVAIYVGQDSIIHAISDGPNRGVTMTPLSARYWRTRYHSARRVLPAPAITADSGWGEGVEFSRGTYTGELENGEPNGRGSMAMNNGDRYEGDFLDGRFHGTGTYTWVSGDRYEGGFSDGELHGSGTYTAADGTIISGRWVAGAYQRNSGSVPAAASDTAADASQPTYIDSQDSPWETWDGVVAGDFYAWQEEQDRAFQEWKQNN